MHFRCPDKECRSSKRVPRVMMVPARCMQTSSIDAPYQLLVKGSCSKYFIQHCKSFFIDVKQLPLCFCCRQRGSTPQMCGNCICLFWSSYQWFGFYYSSNQAAQLLVRVLPRQKHFKPHFYGIHRFLRVKCSSFGYNIL